MAVLITALVIYDAVLRSGLGSRLKPERPGYRLTGLPMSGSRVTSTLLPVGTSRTDIFLPSLLCDDTSTSANTVGEIDVYTRLFIVRPSQHAIYLEAEGS